MKKIVISSLLWFVLLFFLYNGVDAEEPNDAIPPGSVYMLTERSSPDVADSLFTTADSSYKPTYDNGNRAVCKGIYVKYGVSSGFVCVHPNYRSDTTVRHLIRIDSTFDAGYPIPFVFDKIFKSGTTIPLDSIGYCPR